jgi:hypothetical protein
MLEHQMHILRAVADNRELFRKELLKSIKWLNPDQLPEFKQWVNENFHQQYPHMIDEAFYSKPGYA